MSTLRKKIFELQLENTNLKSASNENLENINSMNKKALEASELEKKDLEIEINKIKNENNSLKEKLDLYQKEDAPYTRSKPPGIDEEFSLQKLETDQRYIQYYNKREKRLLMIEEALKKCDEIEARKLFIYEQIQEKFIQDDIKEKLKNQEDQIKIMNDKNQLYDKIKKEIETINQKSQNKEENPFLEENKKLLAENISLKEENEKQKDAYSKFTKAAFKVFSIYKSGFEEISILLRDYQKSYESIIDETSDVALRMNVHHPLISFYQNLSRFILFLPNKSQKE